MGKKLVLTTSGTRGAALQDNKLGAKHPQIAVADKVDLSVFGPGHPQAKVGTSWQRHQPRLERTMNASAPLNPLSPLGDVKTQILHVDISRHTTAAGFVVLLYDFFLTLPDEVRFDHMPDSSLCSLFHRSIVGSSRLVRLSHLRRGFVLHQSICFNHLIAGGELPSV